MTFAGVPLLGRRQGRSQRSVRSRTWTNVPPSPLRGYSPSSRPVPYLVTWLRSTPRSPKTAIAPWDLTPLTPLPNSAVHRAMICAQSSRLCRLMCSCEKMAGFFERGSRSSPASSRQRSLVVLRSGLFLPARGWYSSSWLVSLHLECVSHRDHKMHPAEETSPLIPSARSERELRCSRALPADRHGNHPFDKPIQKVVVSSICSIPRRPCRIRYAKIRYASKNLFHLRL
jgi:hypothetical protein